MAKAKTMKVLIDLKETSQSLEFDAVNAYTKGPFYCVYLPTGQVKKIPVTDIFMVTEAYNKE